MAPHTSALVATMPRLWRQRAVLGSSFAGFHWYVSLQVKNGVLTDIRFRSPLNTFGSVVFVNGKCRVVVVINHSQLV